MFEDTPVGRWRGKNYSQGKCINCGDDMGRSLYSCVCAKCGNRRKIRRRKARGNAPWKPGSPGRPPLRTHPGLSHKKDPLAN